MYRLFLGSMLALIGAANPAHAQLRPSPGAVYFHAEGWAYSEPVPIDAYVDDFRAPLQAGDDALAWLHAEAGVRYGAWRLGWAVQRQYVIEASRGAADLYHRDRNDLPAPPNARFEADLEASFYSVRGLRIGHTVPAFHLDAIEVRMEPSLVLWEGSSFEDGTLKGVATSDADGEPSYVAALAHDYSEDRLLSRGVGRPRGRGASLALEARFALADRWSGELSAHNLLGRLWWQDAPYTTGELDSDTRQVDDSGAVSFDPTLRGFEGYRSHRQRMPLFATIELRRHLGAHRAALSLTHTDIGSFPGFGWSRASGNWEYGVAWLPTARNGFQARLAWKALRVQLGSDARHWKDADYLRLILGLEIPLPHS